MDLVQQENNMKIKIAKVDSLDDLIQNFNSLFKEVEEASSKEECKEECDNECPNECNHQCTEQCPNECENNIQDNGTESEGMELTDDVYMVNDNYFLMANKVRDLNITDNTELVFEHLNGERYVPGITEEQILTVLLYRNRNDKKRYDLIKQLLFN